MTLRRKYDNYGNCKTSVIQIILNSMGKRETAPCITHRVSVPLDWPCGLNYRRGGLYVTARNLATIVPLGEAGQFTLLAMGGSIDDSGPVGPDADPWTEMDQSAWSPRASSFRLPEVSGTVGRFICIRGLASTIRHLECRRPCTASRLMRLLAQARLDAFAASTFALNLPVTGSFGRYSSDHDDQREFGWKLCLQH